MRILRIFGIVVAVHFTAFVFVFAIPGCRSTTRRASNQKPVVESKETNISLPIPGFRSSSSSPVAPSPSDTVLPVTASGPTGGSTIVFPGAGAQSPSRPPAAPADSSEKSTTAQSRTHTVVARDSLWSLAKRYGVTEKELASANRLKPGTPLRIGQVIAVPSAVVPEAGESVSVPAATFNYRVRPGDSLASIAKRAGITPAQLKEMNKLTSDLVRVDQQLVLPATLAAVPPAATVPAPEAAPAKAAKPPKPGMQKHVVKPGESLGLIAKKYGVKLSDVATVNHISNPASLRAGTELWIPGPKTAGAAKVEVPAAESAATAAPTPTPTPVNDNPFVTAPANDSPVAPSTQDSPISGADESFITPAK